MMKLLCIPPSRPYFPTMPRSISIRSRLSFLTENKSYHREFEAAIDVVQKACRLCVDVQSSLFSKGGGILEKGDCTPVTVADYGVQALISMELSRLFPSIPLVAEEDSSQLLLELEKFHQDGNDASMSLVEAVVNVVANSAGFQGEPLNHDEVLNAIDKGAKQTTTLEEKPATYWVVADIQLNVHGVDDAHVGSGVGPY